jgi:hypothetical protein
MQQRLEEQSLCTAQTALQAQQGTSGPQHRTPLLPSRRQRISLLYQGQRLPHALSSPQPLHPLKLPAPGMIRQPALSRLLASPVLYKAALRRLLCPCLRLAQGLLLLHLLCHLLHTCPSLPAGQPHPHHWHLAPLHCPAVLQSQARRSSGRQRMLQLWQVQICGAV